MISFGKTWSSETNQVPGLEKNRFEKTAYRRFDYLRPVAEDNVVIACFVHCLY